MSPTETDIDGYLRSAVEASDDAVIGVDLQGRVHTWNPAAQRMFGYTADEAEGRPVLELVIPGNLAGEARKLLERARAGESIRHFKTRRRTKQGDTVCVALHLSPVHGRDGKVAGVCALARDISQRERAAEQLRFQAQLLDSVQESVVATDLEGRIVYWGKGAETLYGHEPGEALGRHIELIVPPDARDEEAARMQAALETGSWRGEYLQRRKGGSPLWAETFLSVVRDEEGTARGFVGIHRDITDRREAHQALRESEERFRLAFEEGPLGIALVRQDHTVLRANRVLCELLECSEGELMGRSMLDLTHPADVERERGMLRQVFRGGTPRFTMEKRFLTRSRRTRWARLTATAVQDDSGRTRYGLAMIEDVTERKHAEEAVRRSERLASIGTFAAGIAHQINNPLGGILMAAQFALGSRDRADAMETYEQSLEEIEADARRCAEIVRSVLRFARRETPEKKPCRLGEVVRSALSLTGKRVPEGPSLVLREPDGGGPELLASRTDLEQAVANVIQNALESADGGDVDVIVTTTFDDDHATLTVADDGRGIPDEHQQFIFDPFYTTRRERGGTGLGLSMAHAVVTAHGGTIELESTLGRGTTVTIELPLDDRSARGQDA